MFAFYPAAIFRGVPGNVQRQVFFFFIADAVNLALLSRLSLFRYLLLVSWSSFMFWRYECLLGMNLIGGDG